MTFLNDVMTQYFFIPEHVIVADGDRWKLQFVLVFHVQVNVLRVCEKKHDF